ncbi:MAG: hypothetical protein ACLQF0_17065 [Dissulfurispiraceae bacterium]
MSAISEKLAAKKERLNEHWNPAVGDVLEGTVAEIGETPTANSGGGAMYARIQTDSGKRTVFINSVLEKQFDEEGIEEGSVIAIEFLGLVKSRKSNQEYKNYVVVKAD